MSFVETLDQSTKGFFMFAKRKRRSLSVTDDANSTISNNQTDSDDDAIEMVQVFVSINETFEFPKCRRQCSQFYVGRLDFEAVNASVEVRAGDIAEFSCKTGYYIDAPEPVPTYLPTYLVLFAWLNAYQIPQ